MAIDQSLVAGTQRLWMLLRRRAAVFASLSLTCVGLTAAAAPGKRAGSPVPAAEAPPPSELIARQLADETEAVDRALGQVTDKLAAADETRAQRLGAAVRALRVSPGDDALSVARRRAAAKLLLERDASERALLADEAARLTASKTRIADDTARLPEVSWPTALVRPAPGKIARHFGTLVHEKSKATLSRRGVDIEVEDHVAVVAPAAGTVRYAGPIRGLDQGVILDHGGYLTVLAKLGDIALPIGATVAAGDRIGRAARHRVYLEVRIKLGPGGLPIDPEPLLGKH